tara:strand:- start:933 stop:1628 length:696 start_codon:yes stop_codon:yes gene_type:complete
MIISVIIPVYNEENTISKILDKILDLKDLNIEILVVNDGSTDATESNLLSYEKNTKIKIINHKKNLGKGAAIKTAKEHLNGDIIIIQDADLEYDPIDYYLLIKPIKEQKSLVVYGSRVLGKPRYQNKSFTSKFRVFANHLLTIFSNIVNSQKLTDAHTCYKVFDRNVFDQIKLVENGFNFCPEITTKISKKNIQIVEVPVNYYGRGYSEGKKIKLYDGLEAIITLIKYRFF